MARPAGPVVVIGAGQAGGETVAMLRGQGFDGELTLVGDEGILPYSRPPLSKQFLSGEWTADRILLRKPDFYQRFKIGLRIGDPAVRIDRDARQVVLADGDTLAYRNLVIATGGTPRTLPDDGTDRPPNLHYVRTVADVEALRSDLVRGARLVLVGGGYVGLEIAAVARRLDLEVTVVEIADRLLARVAGAELAGFVADRHARHGIDVRLATRVNRFRRDGKGRVTGVELSDASGATCTIGADTVVVGIGLAPNVRLAAECGLDVADGIVVDEFCRTSDPHVYAVGDCARHPCSEHGGLRRLESVANATEQARVVAAAIAGAATPYQAVPWFWSDQADLKLQSVGLAANCDTAVVRPVSGDGQLAVLYLKGGRVRAADIVGNPRLFATAKRLVAARAEAEVEQLADPDFGLETLLTPLAPPEGI
jgi:3-phenylpropionate/trans-cinnamate dioxygenase ferredoxin reductase subunit